MADALLSTVSRISPVHITNQFELATKPVSAGCLIPGSANSVKVYDNLDAVAEDYDPYTPFWKKARAYFAGNSEASSLLGLTYISSGGGSATKAPAPQNITVTPTADGAVVKAAEKKNLQPSVDSNALVLQALADSDLSDDATNAITVLAKYYFAGPEFWFLSEFNSDVAQAVANFIELQNTGIFLAYSSDPADLQSYASNKRTFLMTVPAVDDSTADVQDTYNNVFDAAFAGTMDGRSPHSAVKYALGNLPYVQPQDRYEFTPSDLADLEKYNIVTYAYVLDTPRVVSSRMAADDFHIDIMLGWDWIQNETTTRVTDLFVKNTKQGIAYNQAGFDAVANTIKGVFIDAAGLDIIAPLKDANGAETGRPDYSVDYVSPGQLPKSYETKREMHGITTKYHPMGMVEDVYMENTIVM